MAKRKHKQFRTLDSAEIQGPGSFVKIKSLSLQEIMSHAGNGSKADPAAMGLAVLDEMIVGWDWVDDDDNPLPIPAQNPGTVASLPFQEANWLLTATGLQELFDQKN